MLLIWQTSLGDEDDDAGGRDRRRVTQLIVGRLIADRGGQSMSLEGNSIDLASQFEDWKPSDLQA